MASIAFPDGAVVDHPGPPSRPAGWQVEAHVPQPGRAPSRVLVSEDVAPQAPHLWCVLRAAGPQAPGGDVDLVAFSTAHLDDGTLVGAATLEQLDVGWANQVGAVRWSAGTGVVGQVFVAPEHRRLRVAAKLLMVAAGVRVAQGWASLRSDGRLTDLGDTWLTAAPDWWRSRVPERTAHLPPMDLRPGG
ncbi:GNAT family N-acetyltransferase [Klenkia marina]|uniref:GNAT family N-acetyltransferase n=1 Tax=Klenkia marina TaxID=1960309 RepID=UPI001059C233|nr:GNAT family N-acetyltransferase [Klenkia marina]